MQRFIEKLRIIVQEFISGNYSLEELQSRLETLLVPDEISKIIYDTINELEEIRFTKLEVNQRTYALEALKKMLSKIDANLN